MQVLIKRFDTTLPLPEYKTPGAAALDLSARIEVEIAPQGIGYVPLNVALQVPPEYWVLMSARSSLHKKGVMMANGIGIGDADFCGDGDEYRAVLFNFSQHSVVIERGERIVQIIVLPRERVVLSEVAEMGMKDRGGIGSTGRT